MLPGFRILFATTVLALSVLIFGLGAAALLRAAHEEFANLPSWRLAQQPILAPQFEISGPTLAMLRVEALTAKPSTEKPARQQAIIRDIPRDVPVAKPSDFADGASRSKDAEQGSAQAAPATGAVATPSRQAAEVLAEEPAIPAVKSDDVQPPEASASATRTPEEASQDVKSAEVKVSELRLSEAEATDAIAEPRLTDPKWKSKPSDAKPAGAKPSETIASLARSSETEASEPRSTETVAPIDRSSAATASATIPRPVVKKNRRANLAAIAQRRQIARARAAERARTERLRQQQNAFPLFGGG